MTSRAITRTAGVCGLLLLLAACGGSSGGTSTGAPPTGTPTNGGTLKLLGSGDVDHLDPASAYYTVSYTLERAFTRQLVSYPASSDLTTATTVAPDLATSLPTTSNGGISRPAPGPAAAARPPTGCPRRPGRPSAGAVGRRSPTERA